MPAMQQIRDSGLFFEHTPQATGSVCFQVEEMGTPMRGASIYVVRGESEVHIRVRALELDRFPNNQRLSDFVSSNAHGTVRRVRNPAHAYRLASEHVGDVIDIILAGL